MPTNKYNFDAFNAIVLNVAQFGKDTATFDKMLSQGFIESDLIKYHAEAVKLVDNTIQDGFRPYSYALIQEMHNRAPEYFKTIQFTTEEEFFSTSIPNNSNDYAKNPLAVKYVNVNIIDKQTLLATIEVYPDTPLKDEKLAEIYSLLSRQEAFILSDFSDMHKEFYTTLMVVDKNLPLEKQIPRDIQKISREKQHDMVKLDDKFFAEAFKNDETNQPHFIPVNIRRLSEEFCKTNNIKGTSDPMYIANVTALELGQGDGRSRFIALRSAASEDLDRIAERLNRAYSSNVIDPASTKELVNKHCATAYVLSPELIKSNPSFSYIMTVKDKSGKDIVYGFCDKLSIKTYVDNLNKKGEYISYSISENKKELVMDNIKPTLTDVPDGNNTIMGQLVKAGIKPEQMGNHESDLYVEVNDISKAIVKDYKYKSNVTTFKSNIDGKMNYEIPFAYIPAWDKKVSTGPAETAPGLPRMCYSRNDEIDGVIMLVRGDNGFKPAPYIADVEAQNKSLGVTKAQEEAMKVGSMFGWNVPGADPKTHAHLDSPAPPQVERVPELERGNPNLSITRHSVGDKVKITLENMQVMINNSHSILANPSDTFIAKCRGIYEAKTEGIVTHTFSPGYEVTATFGKDTMHEQSLHMKDNYITNLTQKQSTTIPDFPALSQADKKELTTFADAVTKNYPDTKIENITKLCTIASDMSKYNVQYANGKLSTEQHNSLTDNQENQINDIIKDMPGTKVRLDYEPRGAAIKLELPDVDRSYKDAGGKITGFEPYCVPEIPKNKLIIAPASAKTYTEIVSKKR